MISINSKLNFDKIILYILSFFFIAYCGWDQNGHRNTNENAPEIKKGEFGSYYLIPNDKFNCKLKYISKWAMNYDVNSKMATPINTASYIQSSVETVELDFFAVDVRHMFQEEYALKQLDVYKNKRIIELVGTGLAITSAIGMLLSRDSNQIVFNTLSASLVASAVTSIYCQLTIKINLKRAIKRENYKCYQ